MSGINTIVFQCQVQDHLTPLSPTHDVMENIGSPDLSEPSNVSDLSLNASLTNSVENNTSELEGSLKEDNVIPNDVTKLLKEIRIKNVNRITIGTLNINSQLNN